MIEPLRLTRVYIAVLLMAVTLYGGSCPDNGTNPNPEPTGGSAMRVIAKDFSTVTIHFPQSANATKQAYRISYRAIQSDPGFPSDDFVEDTGSVFAGSYGENHPGVYISRDITDLLPQLYEFRLHIVNDMYQSLPSYDTVIGAPATRYIDDHGTYTGGIVLYERGSELANCLVIEGEYARPTVTTINDAPDGTVMLALLINEEYERTNNFTIADLAVSGTVAAEIPSAKADLTAMLVNDLKFGQKAPLDSFHVSYNQYNAFVDSNFVTNVPLVSETLGANDPVGPKCALLRFGSPRDGSAHATFRWVRIVVKANAFGVRLQGTKPNRYIELEFSIGYPGVPFG